MEVESADIELVRHRLAALRRPLVGPGEELEGDWRSRARRAVVGDGRDHTRHLVDASIRRTGLVDRNRRRLPLVARGARRNYGRRFELF